MTKPSSFDCIVVGGGVVGLSLAYELAGQGIAVAVIERNQLGRGASWAGAGILPPAVMEKNDHAIDKLAALSCQLHSEWSQQLMSETGIDNGYRQCGALYVARTHGEMAALSGQKSHWQDSGIEAYELSAKDVAAIEPAISLDPSAILGAVHLPGEAQIRNPDHLSALVAACHQRGVITIEHAQETEFAVSSDRVLSATVRGTGYIADKFCFATGAWSRGVLEQVGVQISVLPIRGQMVLYRLPQKCFSTIVYEGAQYIVPRDDGHVLVGSTLEEAGFDDSTTPEAIHQLTQFGVSFFEQLRPSCIVRTWAGLRPASFDGFPYIGQLPGLKNAWAACGHFRTGLLLSPATAKVVADLVMHRKPMFDLTPFRVDRG